MSIFAIWQLVDSAFPAGGFAHSWGLEAAWQSGEVGTDHALRNFVTDAVTQAGYGALPLSSATHDDPSRLAALDTLCDAFLTNVVTNRASSVQGRAFLATCARVWPEAVDQLAASSQELHRHHAPIFGAVCRRLDISLELTQRLALYATSRGVLSAAVRLGIVGPYAAQRLQSDLATHLDEVLERCASLREEEIAQTAPIIDLLHANHDRLYSRLFQT